MSDAIKPLDGHVAIVTGAGQGIGRAVTCRLAADGAAVVAADIDLDAARDTAGSIGSSGSALALSCDVSERDSIADLADQAERELGPITIWINNAGRTSPAMLHKMTEEQFDAVWRVNGRGTFFGIQVAAIRMIATGVPGSIVNVTSSAGLQGTIGQINYSASKGAVTSMTKSAARELARYGVRVNAVAPIAATPMTETLRSNEKLSARYLQQIPMGRFGEPDEIADAFAFLAGPNSRYVTGQTLCVDGGLYMVG